jgi:hypothetical protein
LCIQRGNMSSFESAGLGQKMHLVICATCSNVEPCRESCYLSVPVSPN